jgi:hypothetical protein
MVGGFFACRTDYPADLKKPVFDRLLELKSNPSTRHLLTLFQSSGFVLQDANCLRTANSLLETYEQHAAAAGRNR